MQGSLPGYLLACRVASLGYLLASQNSLVGLLASQNSLVGLLASQEQSLRSFEPPRNSL